MSSEVGSGHVVIFPTFKGMKQRTRKELEAVGKSGGSRLEKSLSRAGRDGGAAAGRGFRGMFGRGVQSAVSESTAQLRQGVARAAAQVSKARHTEQDAAGRVRVAEAQLAEARKKHAADSSQVIRAEERLASATRRLETAQGNTTSATDKLKAAQDALAKSAEKAAKGMGFKAAARDLYGVLAPARLVGRTLTGPLVRGAQSFARGWSNVSLVGGNAMTRLGQNTRVLTAQLVGLGASIGSRVAAPFQRAWSSISSGAQRVGAGISRVFAPAARWFAPFGQAVATSVKSAGNLFGRLPGVMGRVTSGISSAWSTGMDGLSRMASATARGIEGIFSGAAVTIGGVMTAALAGGWGRMVSIDNAQAKLAGLGHSAEAVEDIMDSALKSVEGTAFGLGDAADIAASAVAAGVKPGKDLTKYLSTTAAAAAAAGVPLQEMGSILNRATTNGKVYTQELNQLSDRGLPIWQALADEMGVTQDALRDMVSSGEVDAETFTRAVEAMSGDVAQAMGGTVQGTFRNMITSFSKLGATILTPFQDTFKGLFTTVKEGVGALSSALGPVVEVVAESVNGFLIPIFERLQEVFSKGFEFDLDNLGTTFAWLAPIIGALAGSMGPLLARIPLLSGLFAGLTGPVGLLAGALVGLFMVDPSTLADNLTSAISGISSMLESLVSAVADALPGIVSGITTVITDVLPVLVQAAVGLVTALVQGIVEALPALIAAFSSAFPVLAQAIVDAVPLLVEAIVSAVPALVTALVAAIPLLVEGAISLFMGLLDGLVAVIPALVQALIGLLPVIVTAIWEMLPSLVTAAIDLFLGLVTGLMEASYTLVGELVKLLPQLVTSLIGMIPKLVETAIQLFLGIVLGLLKAIPQILVALLKLLPQLIKTLIGMIPELLRAAVDLFLALVKAIPEAIPAIVAAIVDMGPELVSAVLELGPALWEAGKDIIRGLGDGIASMGQWVSDKIGDVVGGAVDWAKGLLGIHSPSRVFRLIGEQTGEGMALGIEGEASRVQRAVTDMVPNARQVTSRLRVAAARVRSQAPSAVPAAAPSGSNSLTFNSYSDDPQVVARTAYEMFRGRIG